MRAVVLAAFPTFTRVFEGRCTWMYSDVKGLVTTGVGNLIDPIELAMGLPWAFSTTGIPASDGEIAQEWHDVKARVDLAPHGGGVFAHVTKLRLSDAAVDELVRGRVASDDAALSKRIAGWEDLCADAQLGVMSMAWAMGPNFAFPKFLAALADQDFATCAEQCAIDAKGNPGVVARNVLNKCLFLTAQSVKDQVLDPDVLHYNAGA